jgi:hypothetical protein
MITDGHMHEVAIIQAALNLQPAVVRRRLTAGRLNGVAHSQPCGSLTECRNG